MSRTARPPGQSGDGRSALVLLACAGVVGCTHRPPLPLPARPLTVTPDAPFRAEPPPLAADTPFALPDVHRAVLDNGLELWVLERPAIPAVRLAVVNRAAGSAAEPRLAGLAHLVAEQLEREPIDHAGRGPGETGTGIGARVDAWGTVAEVEATADEAPFALRKLLRKIRKPGFREDAVSAARLDQLYAIRNDRYDALEAGRRLALERLFGRWHPYANPPLGFAQAVRTFRKDQVERFWAATWAPETCAVIVAGAVVADEVRAVVDEELGDWARSAPPLARPEVTPEPPAPNPGKLQVLNRGLTEPLLLAAFPVPGRTSDAQAAVQVLARVFGGGLTSRVASRLREGSGYTYSAGADYWARDDGGVLFTWATAQPENVGRALSALLEEARRMGEEPPTDEELEVARRVVREGWLARLETNRGAVAALAELFLRGETPETLARFDVALGEVSAADVTRLARAHLVADRAPVMVIGPIWLFQGELHTAGFRDYDLR